MSHPSGSAQRVALGGLDRRQFLRTTAGGGFALGSLFGLGMDLRAAQEEVHHLSIRPYKLKERTVHHVGLPPHWGYKGLTQGDVVNNLPRAGRRSQRDDS